MKFLYKADNHFNLANMLTFVNITAGLNAVYFITQENYFVAIIFAWIGGAADIFDGKIARKYNLSNEFGIQLDSFADFLSFVLVPVFLIFQAIYAKDLSGFSLFVAAAGSIFYVISGLRRLIKFNIDADAGEVDSYFTGVPTPLGAIILMFVYLLYISTVFNAYTVLIAMGVIAYLLNSNLKIKHL